MKALLAALLLAASPAAAHEAPAGWTYGLECCSLNDCYQMTTTVTATRFGWLISETGELVPYGDGRLRVSRDEFFHRCAYNHGTDKRAICLYVPTPAY